MPTIFRRNTERLTVAEAKRLILGALPQEHGGGSVFGRVGPDGEVVWDGESLKLVAAAEAHAPFLDRDFLELCKGLGFEPHMMFSPAIGGYSGNPEDDNAYMLTHAQFVKLAESYSLTVEIGLNEEVTQEAETPASKREGVDGPLPLTTSDIAFCFDGLGWDEMGWRRPLGDKPKWLEPCLVVQGIQGKSERRWNPVAIAAALLHRGYRGVSEKSLRARFQTRPQLKPWLDAWRTYEADYLDTK